MNKERLKYYLVDNIMNYLRKDLLDEIEECSYNLPIFNSVLNVMENMNKYSYTYTLENIDDLLFSKLMREVIEVL